MKGAMGRHSYNKQVKGGTPTNVARRSGSSATSGGGRTSYGSGRNLGRGKRTGAYANNGVKKM